MNVPLGETVWKRCTHIIPYLDKYFILLVSTASFSLQEFSTAFSEQINIFAFQQVWMTRCIHSFRSITSQPLDSLEKTRITKNKTALTPWLLSWCWNSGLLFGCVSDVRTCVLSLSAVDKHLLFEENSCLADLCFDSVTFAFFSPHCLLWVAHLATLPFSHTLF